MWALQEVPVSVSWKALLCRWFGHYWARYHTEQVEEKHGHLTFGSNAEAFCLKCGELKLIWWHGHRFESDA